MTIRSDAQDGILTITIDRPETHNALSRAMGEDLIALWDEFRDNPAHRVAILTGAGDKSFCAGADLKEVGSFYASMTPEERHEHGEKNPGLGGITRNLDPGKPIIAAINGYCLAGGLEFALACDMRIAVPHAKFGLPEVRWGLIPGAGGTQRLPRTVPLGVALEMILSAQTIDAERAMAIGLINRIVEPEALMSTALELADKIARNGPLAVRAARAAVFEGLDLSLDDGIRAEQAHAEIPRQSEDVQEGLRAFVEKREPRFQGK